ncbi:MAG TPA: hypothetical protein VF516_12925 [Kofleriaceae bacterium]
MGETDITFRHLLRDHPQPILRLAFSRNRLTPLGTLDPSVDKPMQRTSDNLFRVRHGAREAAVHIEVEREWRAEIPRRLFEYATSAMVATRLPVWSVVVLLRPGGRPPSGTGVYRIPGPGGDVIQFRYRVVPLWRLDAHRMRKQLGVQGAPYCVAMRGADEAFVRTLAEDVRADRTQPQSDRQSTMQLLYIVSAAILGAETARRIFHMESIIQDPNVQELINEWKDVGRAEGRTEGRTEGRNEGRTEGRTEGRAVEARLLLHKVLAARSFAVSSEVRTRIDGESDVSRLESWLEAAVTASSIDEVFRDR